VTMTHDIPAVDLELQWRVERFFFFEAELLDERRYREWLGCFADDIHYWAPIRSSRPPRERAHELSASDELATFDEDRRSLDQRVRKLETGKAWAEEPPSRVRHCISNVRLRLADGGVESRCNFIVYQGRGEVSEYWFVGERHDTLRFAPEGALGLLVARRKIVFDHTTLLAPSISIFF
jgi:3-phenylpropionate/cinnamic acid dioxygenase small subunit